MNKLYVGIDPSINSTGVCIITKNDEEIVNQQFYIIKPDKLTKRESEAELKIPNFMYLLYNKKDSAIDDNHIAELNKTANFLSIIDLIANIVWQYSNKYNTDDITVCQEGISYGSSIRTKSVFDLAGLNYLIRSKFINKTKLLIATPAEIKKFATGKGNANKDSMNGVFESIFPEFKSIPKHDDLADAYFMANYGMREDFCDTPLKF